MATQNDNTKLKIRSKVWSEFLQADKDVYFLAKNCIEISKEIKIAQDCGDVQKWQELSNKRREIATKATILEMKRQMFFVDIVNINEFQTNHNFN